MKVSSEFSKYAKHYEDNNVIQNMVIDKLLSLSSSQPKEILDLGCGSGALCKKIGWNYNHFIGVDFAKGMLELHPKSSKIKPIYGNFNDKELFHHLQTYDFERIFSASALQWADDLDGVFEQIKKLDAPISLAIFSANTFKTLNKTASLEPLLKSVDEVLNLQKKYFDAKFEVVNYTLEFDSTRDMFKYIKQSGVSGSRSVLSYKDTKKLMAEYPLNYLEFEVLFLYN